jgi:hypothetical protein
LTWKAPKLGCSLPKSATCATIEIGPPAARPQGWISLVLLVNGRMQGVWRHEIKGSRVEVAIEPFIEIPRWVRRAAGQEAERLAAFLGLTLSVEFHNP